MITTNEKLILEIMTDHSVFKNILLGNLTIAQFHYWVESVAESAYRRGLNAPRTKEQAGSL